MAQTSATGKHRAAPLEITPEAREWLTPFRERTFRAMYDAAIADGGAEVIASAQLVFEQPIWGELDDTLSLACWVDGTREEAQQVEQRISVCISALHQAWSEAERADYAHIITFAAPLLPEHLRRASA